MPQKHYFQMLASFLPPRSHLWVVVQKLPQLSDPHFSQVLNKLEKKFFPGFIKYHLPLHFIQIIQVYPTPNNNRMDFKVKSSIAVDVATHIYKLLFHSLFKVEFDIDHFVLGEHRER